MEAKLRYKRDLNSFGVQGSLGKKKTPPKRVVNKVEKEVKKEPEPPVKLKPKSEPRIDFIQRNIQKASEQKSRQKLPKPSLPDYSSNHKPGEIPKYIGSRKSEIRTEESHPSGVQIPKGMRLLSEEEKSEAISNLNEQKEQILSQLAHAPLKLESPQLIRQKRLLEAELNEIETSIQQLSKQYVFAPADD